MCNLYTIRKSAAEVAAHFGVDAPPAEANAPRNTYPGAPGLVAREIDGRLSLQSMVWGFPRPMKSKKTGLPIKPKPVNNIADLSNWMWRHIAPKPENRCIIPLTMFAEAEGLEGSMTRTWFRVKGHPIFAWGGMWRDSTEWGPVYSGLMTNCNEAIRETHDRMPVLLLPEDYDRWLRGGLEDVIAFRDRCFPDELIERSRSTDAWILKKGIPESAESDFVWTNPMPNPL
jgi:putative SOS response-associated peptidase YedK